MARDFAKGYNSINWKNDGNGNSYQVLYKCNDHKSCKKCIKVLKMKPTDNFFLLENGHNHSSELNEDRSTCKGIWGPQRQKILKLNAENSLGAKGIYARLQLDNEKDPFNAIEIPPLPKIKHLLNSNRSLAKFSSSLDLTQ